MTVCDLRSDTVTLPTPEMMAAIASAPLGDAARGDDPTVRALERRACELTGKDDALLLPSGTMANLAALIAHGCRGGEVIVERDAHLYNAEGGGVSALVSALVRPLAGRCGVLEADDVHAALRDGSDAARAPTRLICLENTHNAAGGTVWPLEDLAAIGALAREARVPVHLDGARLFNAAAHLDVPLQRLCRDADSVWFALCKGLCCPVGAVLAGGGAFMREARRAARMLGGAMRQAGVLAAPALVALRDPLPAHRRDHALATRLARGIAAIDASLVDLARVQTNIVNCDVGRVGADATDVEQALRARGVRANHRGRNLLRFVTHADVDDVAIDAAVHAVAAVLSTHREGRQA
jgi:threonine aldolase